MFYAHFVLAKKGPLARIWLAAHWDKKLTKAHVFETSIEKSVEGILHPKVKMALRTSGHLLLGVVRIYSRKAKYLLADCNEAFVKIKMAFRPGMVDLPEESREAAVNAITLPEVFHDFDTSIPEINDADIQAQLSMNQSRAEEITLREDYGSLSLPNADEGFGDLDLDAPEFIREAHSTPVGLFGENSDRVVDKSVELDRDGDFGSSEMMAAGGLFEDGLFGDTPMDIPPAIPSTSAAAAGLSSPMHLDSDDDFEGPPSIASFGSAPPSPQKPDLPIEKDLFQVLNEPAVVEEESFALAPIEMPLMRGGLRPGSKRKRKLVVDEVKNISGEEMKGQLSDTSDIVTTLDLAPPTKRLMHWKETGGVEKLFALPGRHIPSKIVARNYQTHLTSRPAENEDQEEGVVEEEPPALGPPQELEEQPTPVISPQKDKDKKKRATKRKASDAFDEIIEPPLLQASVTVVSDESSFFRSGGAGMNMSMMENMGYDGSLEQARDLGVGDLGLGLADNVDKMLGSVATPWGGNEDYDFPASVGQVDEQLAEETYEEYEERILNRRALQMYHIIKSKLEDAVDLSFNTAMCNPKNSRKQVAQKFYTLLVLKKAQAIEMVQEGSYEPIVVGRGPKFETASL